MKKSFLCFVLAMCFVLGSAIASCAVGVLDFRINAGAVPVVTSDTTTYPKHEELSAGQVDSEGRVQVYIVGHETEHQYLFVCDATQQFLRISTPANRNGNVWNWVGNTAFGSPAYVVGIANTQTLAPYAAHYDTTGAVCAPYNPYMTQYIVGIADSEVGRSRVYWYPVPDISAKVYSFDNAKQLSQDSISVSGWAINYSGLKDVVAYINNSENFSKTGYSITLAKQQRADIKAVLPSPALGTDPLYKCGFASAIVPSDTKRVGQFYVSNLVTFNDGTTTELPVRPVVLCYAPNVSASISGENVYPKGATASPLTVKPSFAEPETNGTTSFTYSYQWYKNGVAIAGATGQSYTPDQTSMSTIGENTYSCDVTLTVTASGQALQNGNIVNDTITKTSLATASCTVAVYEANANINFRVKSGGIPVVTSDTTTYPKHEELTTGQVDAAGRVQVYIVGHETEHEYEFSCNATQQYLRISTPQNRDTNVWNWVGNTGFGSPANVVAFTNWLSLAPAWAYYDTTGTICQLYNPYMTQYIVGIGGTELDRSRVYWYPVPDINARVYSTDSARQVAQGTLSISGWAINYSGLKDVVAYINNSESFSKTGYSMTLAKQQRADIKAVLPSPALGTDPLYNCGFASAIVPSDTQRIGQYYVSNLVTFNDGTTMELPVRPIVICYAPNVSANISGTKAYKKGDSAQALTVEPSYTKPETNGTTSFTYSYQWYKNGKAIAGATQSSYTPDNTTLDTPGSHTYSCNVTLKVTAEGQAWDGGILVKKETITKYSETTATCTVVVANMPIIIEDISGTENVAVGENKTITIKATSPDGGKLSYQWYHKNGIAIPGATAASYVATSSSIATQSYYCVVTNTATVDDSMATNSVTSGTKTLVFYQPVSKPSFGVTSQKVYYPANAALSVKNLSVRYAQSITYQWYENTTYTTVGGKAISGATTDSYTPNGGKQAGVYYYYVTITASYTSKGVETTDSHSVCATYTVENYTLPIKVPNTDTVLCSSAAGMTVELEEYQTFSDFYNLDDEEYVEQQTAGGDLIVARIYMRGEAIFNAVGVSLAFDKQKLVPANINNRDEISCVYGQNNYTARKSVQDDCVAEGFTCGLTDIKTDKNGQDLYYALFYANPNVMKEKKAGANEKVEIGTILFARAVSENIIDSSAISYYDGNDDAIRAAYKTNWIYNSYAINQCEGVASAAEWTIPGAFSIVYPTPMPAVVSVKASANPNSLFVGETATLSAVATYANGATKTVDAVYTVDKNGTISNHIFTATGAGTAKITATFKNISGTTNITVKAVEATDMTLTPSTTEVKVGESLTVSALVSYNNGTTKTVTDGLAISAEPTDAIAAEGNKITVVRGGSITVTVTYEGITKSFAVLGMQATDMILTTSATQVKVGESLTVSALVSYNNGTTKTVTDGLVISAEPADAITAEGNKITIVRGGNTTIFVSYEGINKSFTVLGVQASSLTVTPSTTEVKVGEPLTVSALVSYNDGTTKTVTDGLSIFADPADAITAEGNTITVTKAGTVNVTVSFEGVTDTFTITAKEEPQGLKGDVNCDGKVLINDLVLLLSHFTTGTDLSEQGAINAEITGDGKLLMNDFVKLLYFLTYGSWN